jgi:hypothetical protein
MPPRAGVLHRNCRQLSSTTVVRTVVRLGNEQLPPPRGMGMSLTSPSALLIIAGEADQVAAAPNLDARVGQAILATVGPVLLDVRSGLTQTVDALADWTVGAIPGVF